MAHYTDFANYTTILLIPIIATAMTMIWFNMLDMPTRLPFKPFNCFTCFTFWITVIITILFHTKIITFDVILILTTIATGFIIGYEIDKRQYK